MFWVEQLQWPNALLTRLEMLDINLNSDKLSATSQRHSALFCMSIARNNSGDGRSAHCRQAIGYLRPKHHIQCLENRILLTNDFGKLSLRLNKLIPCCWSEEQGVQKRAPPLGHWQQNIFQQLEALPWRNYLRWFILMLGSHLCLWNQASQLNVQSWTYSISSQPLKVATFPFFPFAHTVCEFHQYWWTVQDMRNYEM